MKIGEYAPRYRSISLRFGFARAYFWSKTRIHVPAFYDFVNLWELDG